MALWNTIIKKALKINKKGTKFSKPCNNVKMPRSPRDSGKNARPRASKTVLGTRATLYVPRTVLEALGRHLFQDPSVKGGVLAQDDLILVFIGKYYFDSFAHHPHP